MPDIAQNSVNYRFSAAVAGFGMLLRESEFKGNSNYDAMAQLAQGSMGNDPNGDRAEFVQLIRIAQRLVKDDKGAAEK